MDQTIPVIKRHQIDYSGQIQPFKGKWGSVNKLAIIDIEIQALCVHMAFNKFCNLAEMTKTLHSFKAMIKNKTNSYKKNDQNKTQETDY